MGRRQDFGSIEFESMEFFAYRNLKLKTYFNSIYLIDRIIIINKFYLFNVPYKY